MVQEFARPTPQRGVAETVGNRVERWTDRWNDGVAWFGLGRLIASASAVLTVCLGAYWLVRSPQPPIEASLPVATTTVTVIGSATATLPPPSTLPEAISAPLDGSVTVHVAGAVHTPGVYQLRTGDRVGQAVDAAGGATAEGRPDELNLAAVIVDGSRVYVPIDGETVPIAISTVDPVGDDTTVPSGPIDVNRAGAADLETLPGVGPTTAAAIVAERTRNGPFLTVDDLERVPGVGPGKIAGLRDLVVV